MLALTYQGAGEVKLMSVPDPVLLHDDDVLVRVTLTGICGSDLHLYHDKIPSVEKGDILGHEFMGTVVKVGSAVTAVAEGDRVVVPFIIACGECYFCKQQLYAACEATNPNPAIISGEHPTHSGAALFGYGHLYGGVAGGQAEYVRVPKGNTNAFKVPEGISDEAALLLSDTLPTAWQAVKNAQIGPGSSLAIFGAGPVGLLAAECARLLGAEDIYLVDEYSYRLNFAVQAYGVKPVNFYHDHDPAQTILKQTRDMRGVDAVIDAVGFEASGTTLEAVMNIFGFEGSSGKALRQCIETVRRGGIISVAGMYSGLMHSLQLGAAFDKGLSFHMGKTHVHKYLPELCEHLLAGNLHPERLITHRLPLKDAVLGYEMYDEKRPGCCKVILKLDA
ncbi:zinc-dependent alcohol dehydrogenase [Pseudomonas sp. RP23018S]|uniref:zinc-dependent alcohol dehydrogenase n=1 Tax=Pseudomonas sp. RP23018S TaxID=3096037 RepID=UPI002ACA051F|nr:zinc-dependent alcohol dehydrogenase [Pseudomonas sp. RP23018S]MDZ5605453.1 zinc-dependent alcohol dehydrogenase [Pseudomonas sp. RP23018S]